MSARGVRLILTAFSVLLYSSFFFTKYKEHARKECKRALNHKQVSRDKSFIILYYGLCVIALVWDILLCHRQNIDLLTVAALKAIMHWLHFAASIAVMYLRDMMF